MKYKFTNDYDDEEGARNRRTYDVYLDGQKQNTQHVQMAEPGKWGSVALYNWRKGNTETKRGCVELHHIETGVVITE